MNLPKRAARLATDAPIMNNSTHVAPAWPAPEVLERFREKPQQELVYYDLPEPRWEGRCIALAFPVMFSMQGELNE